MPIDISPTAISPRLLRLLQFRLSQFRLERASATSGLPKKYYLQCRAYFHSYSGFPYWCSLLIINFQQMLCAIYIGSGQRRVDYCRHRQRGEPML